MHDSPIISKLRVFPRVRKMYPSIRDHKVFTTEELIELNNSNLPPGGKPVTQLQVQVGNTIYLVDIGPPTYIDDYTIRLRRTDTKGFVIKMSYNTDIKLSVLDSDNKLIVIEESTITQGSSIDMPLPPAVIFTHQIDNSKNVVDSGKRANALLFEQVRPKGGPFGLLA